MKVKLIFLILSIVVLQISCGNQKKSIDPTDSITRSKDTAMIRMAEKPTIDTLHTDESVTIPPEVDELFDDFIFNFSSNEALQRERIVFPLSYYKGDSCIKVSAENWRYDALFARQNYYTLLFDKEEDMDLVGDTTLTSVQVEWYFLSTRTVRRYYFERIKGKWMLEAINLRGLKASDNEDFVDFYRSFATDSLYRTAHIRNPLEFITIDPDDEFSILETTLEPSGWSSFGVALPVDRLSNINYGQRNADSATSKILKLNGVGNGYSTACYFRKRAGGAWELYRYEDTGI